MGRTRDSGLAKAVFADRREAGRRLAEKLAGYANRTDVIVLALPRGGVPVGFEVAEALRAPLDVFLVRKLGLPGHEELAVGAVASGGVPLVNARISHGSRCPTNRSSVDRSRENGSCPTRTRVPRRTLRRAMCEQDGRPRRRRSRDGIVDAGCRHRLRQHNPARLVVAVPVAPPEVCDTFRRLADDVICAFTPTPFTAVSEWYDDFAQTTDDEVRRLLALSPASAEQP